MSERNLIFLLEDIDQAIKEIILFTHSFTFEMYLADSKTRYAVESNFSIIGEAASRISKEYQDFNSQIKWRDLKDFRNIVVHEYFGLDHNIVWYIIENDLKVLQKEIIQLLAKN